MSCVRRLLVLSAVLILLGGCTRDRIEGLNEVLEADPVAVADISRAAGAGAGMEEPPKPINYVVQAGDTLSGLAEKYHTSVEALRDLNSQLTSDQLYPGDEILIPVVEGAPDITAAGQPTPQALEYYTVQEGDIISVLAEEWGVTLEDVRRVNPLIDLDQVAVGQRLAIPEAAPPAVEEDPDAIYHTVQAGETLNGLAFQYGVEPLAIVKLNRLSTPDHLQIGQRLRLPDDALLAPPLPEAPASGEGVLHTVRAGETLSDIALYYEVNLQILVAANSLGNEDQLAVGQTLFIPGVLPSAQETPLSAPPTPDEGILHTVRAGETLSGLALLYGVSVQTLVAANSLGNEDQLAVGQSLFVPGAEAPLTQTSPLPETPVAGEGILHTVRAGETLSGLALNYGVSMQALVAANNLDNEDRLAIGQVLFIPGVSPSAQIPSPAEAPVAGQGIQHTVRAGETLSGLALRYGVSVQALVAANNLGNEDRLAVDQVLFIPGVSPSAQTPPPAEAPVAGESHLHIVQAGETLFGLALRYEVSVPALAAANNLDTDARLAIDQTLVIPGTAPSSTPSPQDTEEQSPDPEEKPEEHLIHTVEEGETLLSIAEYYNVTTQALRNFNRLTSPAVLSVGQELLIPLSSE